MAATVERGAPLCPQVPCNRHVHSVVQLFAAYGAAPLPDREPGQPVTPGMKRTLIVPTLLLSHEAHFVCSCTLDQRARRQALSNSLRVCAISRRISVVTCMQPACLEIQHAVSGARRG